MLRLPAGTVVPNAEEWLAAVPEEFRHGAQHRSRYHQVRRGDTLGGIASRYRTSVSTLVVLNNLPSRHRIFPGQVLQLPEGRRSRGKRKLNIVKSAKASPKPKASPQPKMIPRRRSNPSMDRRLPRPTTLPGVDSRETTCS